MHRSHRYNAAAHTPRGRHNHMCSIAVAGCVYRSLPSVFDRLPHQVPELCSYVHTQADDDVPGLCTFFVESSTTNRSYKHRVPKNILTVTDCCVSSTAPPIDPRGCRYHWLHLDLQRVTLNRLRLFCRGGSAKSFYSDAPPPLTALKLLDRPRGTACSARNNLAVPNLRPSRWGVVQTKCRVTMVLYGLLRPYKTVMSVTALP